MNDAEDAIRPAQEVARRSLALFAAVGTALGAPRDEVIPWLRTEGLWCALTPHEIAYLEQTDPPEKAQINFSWQSERLIVLLWALGEISELPDSATQCDTSVFQSILPPFAEASTQAFIARATLIDTASLWKQAELYLEDHGGRATLGFTSVQCRPVSISRSFRSDTMRSTGLSDTRACLGTM